MAAFEYRFATGAVHKVSAQSVGEVCEQLEKSEGGLSPQALLDASRNPDAPLHDEFDWDDTVAAKKWRLEQARLLIAHVRIVRSDDEQERQDYKERGFVSTPGRQSVYVSMDTALHRDDYRKHLLEQARRDSETFIAKYRRIEQLAAVVTAMEEFLQVG